MTFDLSNSSAWVVAEPIRETIEPNIPTTRGVSLLKVSQQIKLAVQTYEFESLNEHPEQVTGFKEKSNENRKRIRKYLNALKLSQEFFSNGQNCLRVLGNYETLPFDAMRAVIDRGIKCLERNLADFSEGGRPRQDARRKLINSLRLIWTDATGKSAGVTTRKPKGGGPFVRFAWTVALPVLHERDKVGFNDALVVERKKSGKTPR